LQHGVPVEEHEAFLPVLDPYRSDPRFGTNKRGDHAVATPVKSNPFTTAGSFLAEASNLSRGFDALNPVVVEPVIEPELNWVPAMTKDYVNHISLYSMRAGRES